MSIKNCCPCLYHSYRSDAVTTTYMCLYGVPLEISKEVKVKNFANDTYYYTTAPMGGVCKFKYMKREEKTKHPFPHCKSQLTVNKRSGLVVSLYIPIDDGVAEVPLEVDK